MKQLHFIVLIICISLGFSNAFAQVYDYREPDIRLLPKKITFPSFTLTFKSYDIYDADRNDEDFADLQIKGKKEQSLFYGISSREKVSVQEIKAGMEKIASMVSKYIRAADSNMVNTRYLVFSIGIDKYNDSFLRSKKHVTFILTTTDRKLRKWYYDYSLFDGDTALTHLYDIDYIQKLTATICENGKRSITI